MLQQNVSSNKTAMWHLVPQIHFMHVSNFIIFCIKMHVFLRNYLALVKIY